MKKTRFLVQGLFSILALTLIGCASGHCRGKKDNDQKSVFVFKPDGSRQCAQGQPVKVEDMGKELSGITIRSQENRSDGKMHVMMCGGPTGRINVYEIMEKDLAEAKKRGFEVWVKEEVTIEQIQRLILDVKDFPKPGIVFKDITPVLENGEAFQALAKHFAERVLPGTDKLVAIESRGFILGAAVAQHCRAGLVIARKPGKLPRATEKEVYALEYGTDSLEIHRDALKPGDRVMIIDDVLATGGTAAATEKLCHRLGAQVLGSLFLMELTFLKGKEKLKSPYQALLQI